MVLREPADEFDGPLVFWVLIYVGGWLIFGLLGDGESRFVTGFSGEEGKCPKIFRL